MYNVVLYEPEIPQNTGNIMRTCAAMGWHLHLIEPLGFYMDEKHLRRAGLDYRDMIEYRIYHDWEAFTKENTGVFYYVTRYGKKAPDSFVYPQDKDIYLVFGKESTGIDKRILRENPDWCMRIPMIAEARSMNLSNCAALCMYEVMRQHGYPGLSRTEYLKGEDFLQNTGKEEQT